MKLTNIFLVTLIHSIHSHIVQLFHLNSEHIRLKPNTSSVLQPIFLLIIIGKIEKCGTNSIFSPPPPYFSPNPPPKKKPSFSINLKWKFARTFSKEKKGEERENCFVVAQIVVPDVIYPLRSNSSCSLFVVCVCVVGQTGAEISVSIARITSD